MENRNRHQIYPRPLSVPLDIYEDSIRQMSEYIVKSINNGKRPDYYKWFGADYYFNVSFKDKWGDWMKLLFDSITEYVVDRRFSSETHNA